MCCLNPKSYFWLVPTFAFVALPLLESILPPNKINHEIDEESDRLSNKFFDFLLYLNFPLIIAIVYLSITKFPSAGLTNLELALAIFSSGAVLGSSGINVAHEIGHRDNAFDHWYSRMMLSLSLYMHFHIEHNLGHHKNVATKEDPATASKGEWLYIFWIKSVVGAYLHAWKIENRIVRSSKGTIWDLSNRMFQFHIIQGILLFNIYWFLGFTALVYFVIIAISSVLLLETINYVEHYGLLRNKMDNGRYESVKPRHSWNSDHIMGRIFLYELTRHSDHHYKANRKYQILRSIEESPQLPLGYPGSMVLALFPPLWFSVMNKRLAAFNGA
jgi:alkane 1-monooxygenase